MKLKNILRNVTAMALPLALLEVVREISKS